HLSGQLGADLCEEGVRLSYRLSRLEGLMRGHVCGGAHRGAARLCGRPALPARDATGAAMARVAQAAKLPWRNLAWGVARLLPILLLALGWELFARYGNVTPFMLPRL